MNTVPFLQQLARKRRIHTALLAALALLGSAVIILLAGAWWDVLRPWPPGLRMRLRLLVPAALLVIWLQAVVRRTARYTVANSAAALERLNPTLGQRLRTAVEIKSSGIPVASSREYQVLAGAVIQSSDRAVEDLDPSPLIPAHHTRLVAALSVFLVLLALFLASRHNDYALALKRVAGVSNRTYTSLQWKDFPRFRDDRHPARIALQVGGRKIAPVLEIRTETTDWQPLQLTALTDGNSYDLIITDRPETLLVRAAAGDAELPPTTIPWHVIPRLIASGSTIRYPAYTGLPPASAQGGDVRSLEGAQVEWFFTFSAPPARAEWQLEGDPPVDLTADAEHTIRPGCTAFTGKRQPTLPIYYATGTSLDCWRYQLEGYPDALPTVELLDPAKDLEATAVTEFPVRIRAKDDFGLAEVGLILDSAGNRDWILEQTVATSNQRDLNQVVSAMLEKVPLSIRDNVRLHAYALDHKPRGGPRAVSTLRSVDIREFKKRARFLGQATNAPKPDQQQQEANRKKAREINDLITKLDEIIKRQRTYTSDVFGFQQAAVVPPKDRIDQLFQQEDTLHRSAVAMEAKWKETPTITADDVALLSAAGDQLRDSARSLLIPNLAGAFSEGDTALATLLQLRKSLIQQLMKANSNEGEKPEDPPKDIKELAREARRLAKEELDVRSQLEPPDPAKLPATRRQQEVALYDGGELFAAIVTHCERSDGALELMAAAEKLMKAADQSINTPAQPSAHQEQHND